MKFIKEAILNAPLLIINTPPFLFIMFLFGVLFLRESKFGDNFPEPLNIFLSKFFLFSWFFLILYFIVSGIYACYIIAEDKGRNAKLWSLFGLISPLGVIIVRRMNHPAAS